MIERQEKNSLPGLRVGWAMAIDILSMAMAHPAAPVLHFLLSAPCMDPQSSAQVYASPLYSTLEGDILPCPGEHFTRPVGDFTLHESQNVPGGGGGGGGGGGVGRQTVQYVCYTVCY